MIQGPTCGTALTVTRSHEVGLAEVTLSLMGANGT